jgi:hypothetical protein
MKLLTAHNLNTRPSDFSFTELGEIVVPNHLVCDSGPSCGCERAVVGVTTHRATTTMRVTDQPLCAPDITALIGSYAAATGLTEADARQLFTESAAVAAQLPDGTILRIEATGGHWIYSFDRGATEAREGAK